MSNDSQTPGNEAPGKFKRRQVLKLLGLSATAAYAAPLLTGVSGAAAQTWPARVTRGTRPTRPTRITRVTRPTRITRITRVTRPTRMTRLTRMSRPGFFRFWPWR